MDTALVRTRAAVERVREVKRALVQRVFSEGLRREPTRKTAIERGESVGFGGLRIQWQALVFGSTRISYEEVEEISLVSGHLYLWVRSTERPALVLPAISQKTLPIFELLRRLIGRGP